MHPTIRAILAQTDQQFWKDTGYKPGKRLDYRDREDAKMIPVWLTIEHSVLSSLLEALRSEPGASPATIQLLADYKRQLDRRFAEDPSILTRSLMMTAALQKRRTEQTG